MVATDVYTWKLLRRDRGLGRDRTENRMHTPGDRRSSARTVRPDHEGTDMTEILFVTWDGGGNVPPALGIAAELVGARPRRPLPRATPASATVAEAAGFEFAPDRGTPAPSPPSTTTPRSP